MPGITLATKNEKTSLERMAASRLLAHSPKFQRDVKRTVPYKAVDTAYTIRKVSSFGRITMSETILGRSLMESCICTRFVFPLATTDFQVAMFFVSLLRCILLVVTILASVPELILSFPIKRSIPQYWVGLGIERNKLQQPLMLTELGKRPTPITSNDERHQGGRSMKRNSGNFEKQVESVTINLADKKSNSVSEYRNMLHWLQPLDGHFLGARIAKMGNLIERIIRAIGRFADIAQFSSHPSEPTIYRRWNHVLIPSFKYSHDEDHSHRAKSVHDNKKSLLSSAPYKRYAKDSKISALGVLEPLDLQDSRGKHAKSKGRKNASPGCPTRAPLPSKKTSQTSILRNEHQTKRKRNDYSASASNFARVYRKLNHKHQGHRISKEKHNRVVNGEGRVFDNTFGKAKSKSKEDPFSQSPLCLGKKVPWEKKSADNIQSSGDEWTTPSDPRLVGTTLGVFNYLKTMGVKSLAAAPCGTTRVWFPTILRKLEKEGFRLLFYCIDSDVSEPEAREIKLAFSGLSSLKAGGSIRTNLESIEDVMPRNLDVVISWFGIRSWGSRKSMRFVRGLRRSDAKKTIFTGMCSNVDNDMDKSWTESESSMTSFWAYNVNGLRRSKFDDCSQMVVYSIN